ncbi:MAG: hypothetical protein INQ03_21315 [Candidatus Heimdallarchaeota archaeon]|nr:hypothetical protein [Candidatus Heimdallarchaeota archaeon]
MNEISISSDDLMFALTKLGLLLRHYPKFYDFILIRSIEQDVDLRRMKVAAILYHYRLQIYQRMKNDMVYGLNHKNTRKIKDSQRKYLISIREYIRSFKSKYQNSPRLEYLAETDLADVLPHIHEISEIAINKNVKQPFSEDLIFKMGVNWVIFCVPSVSPCPQINYIFVVNLSEIELNANLEMILLKFETLNMIEVYNDRIYEIEVKKTSIPDLHNLIIDIHFLLED